MSSRCTPRSRRRNSQPTRSGHTRRGGTRTTLWLFRPAWERMEDRTLLATMLWANSAGGDWDTRSNWVNSTDSSDHHVPTSSDDAEINVSGITVTHTWSSVRRGQQCERRQRHDLEPHQRHVIAG